MKKRGQRGKRNHVILTLYIVVNIFIMIVLGFCLEKAYITTIYFGLLLIINLIYVKYEAKKKQNEIEMQAERAVQSYDQILTMTASDTYKAIRRVDLTTGKSDLIYFEDHCVRQKEIGDWMTWVISQEKNVHPDDFAHLLWFLSLDHLKEMEDGVTYTENYRSAKKAENGYYRTYTTTASIEIVEGKRIALFTTIDTSEVVNEQLEQKRILASAASIYVSMHLIDLRQDTLSVLNSADHISRIVGDKTTHVQELLNDTMRKLTDEQFLEPMMEFIDFQTLDERMKGINTITFEFLGNISGWCRARFIAVDYDEHGGLCRVLWVVENIDAEKRKSNQLLYLSETDLMTGIRNRGSGEAQIKKLLSENIGGTFYVMDVDDFKSINDSYGHGVGDRVLVEIASCLKNTFRESDIVMRLGGDEFAVFAKDMVDKQAAKELLDRFFVRLEQMDIPELGQRKINMSVGAATNYEKDSVDFERLYRKADACAYQSKKEMGNTFTYFEKE